MTIYANGFNESGMKAVPFTQVKIDDEFWSPRLKTHKEITLAACLEQCEKTGRLTNFAKAGGLMEGEFEGIFYNDSDVYKLIEGIAYSLMNHPDPELERRTDQIIDWIAAAQQEDGYVQTYFTLKKPDQKWTDMNMHECYCAGHLIEAAIAYKQATGKTKLFDVARRFADLIDSLFGPGKRHWVPGHQEIELALVKLYFETKDEKYWKLARFFLEERGKGHGVGYSWNREGWGAEYCQDDTPIERLKDAKGHAVRALYMYSAIADIAAITGDRAYLDALDRLWDSVVNRNMYITGGVGSSHHNEGFTRDFDLPNREAYCETCASVAMILWNHRMNLLHGDAKYADIIELELYNGALSGVSLSGDRFFYVNPLESTGSHHRVHWFDCSCCPTQIARFLPSIGNYAYAVDREGIVVNQYISGEAELAWNGAAVRLAQRTAYPWSGEIAIDVLESADLEYAVRLRVPSWCRTFALAVNGEAVQAAEVSKGYIRLHRKWRPGDRIVLSLVMDVQRLYAPPQVQANQGRTALKRGPVVYCVEEADNAGSLESVGLSAGSVFMTEFRSDLLGGVTVIREVPRHPRRGIIAVPYYAWDNREPGWMQVWLKETP
jgi:hypothetical protein